MENQRNNMESVVDFDVKKLKIVSVDEILPNPWNPKDEGGEDYDNVVRSIRENGQKAPILVRELKGKYQIIDGEQKWKAIKELGFDKCLIYNEGKVDDKKAEELTHWFQVQVKYNQAKLAKHVSQMISKYGQSNLSLPFSEKRLHEMSELVKFNWDNYQKSPTPDGGVGGEGGGEAPPEMRTLNIVMPKPQYDVIMEAMNLCREQIGDKDLSQNRCLELICADYLAGTG